jgi:hypothetical protein|tara:strand:- start:97 stop:276 length:180 start_codon:yes stop_codon:yes gene_type:complete
MEIAKNRIIGLLKIIDHLDKENKTLRDANINGYKKYEQLKTMLLSRSIKPEVKDEKEDI